MRSTQTNIFRFSIFNSLLLFFSILYSDKLWSELWILDGFFDLIVIVLWLWFFVASIILWFKKKVEHPYIPFLINSFTLILILVLPLNYIRNRTGLYVFKSDYEQAAKLVYKEVRDSTNTIYKLPNQYQSLSVGGGDAWAINNSQGNAVFFFTFRGTPDGLAGFVKVINGKNSAVFTKNIGSEISIVKDLGDGWYYIVGN